MVVSGYRLGMVGRAVIFRIERVSHHWDLARFKENRRDHCSYLGIPHSTILYSKVPANFSHLLSGDSRHAGAQS